MTELFSKKAESGFGKFIDNIIKLPGWAEPFDGFLATQLLKFIDSKYGTLISDTYAVLFAGVNKVFENYDDTGVFEVVDLIVIEDVVSVINTLVDIPSLTEDEEAILFSGILTGVFQVIKNYLLKAKSTKTV
jgi:hypothetical protein